MRLLCFLALCILTLIQSAQEKQVKKEEKQLMTDHNERFICVEKSNSLLHS